MGEWIGWLGRDFFLFAIAKQEYVVKLTPALLEHVVRRSGDDADKFLSLMGIYQSISTEQAKCRLQLKQLADRYHAEIAGINAQMQQMQQACDHPGQTDAVCDICGAARS